MGLTTRDQAGRLVFNNKAFIEDTTMATFQALRFIETDEEETARLGTAAPGSQYRNLSRLPVLNHIIDNFRLYELVGTGPGSAKPCSGVTGGLAHNCDGSHRVVVLPLEYRPGPSADRPLSERKHDGSWNCRVVISDHPSYPAGGHDLSISVSELRRSPIVSI